jgi:hypothetical protein
VGGRLATCGESISWCYAFASRPFSPWHVASLVAPMDVLYFPSPQSTHVASLVAPVDELNFPAAQSSHVAWLVAPVEELNFPAAQSEQEVAPTALNVPAEQGPSQSELDVPRVGL